MNASSLLAVALLFSQSQIESEAPPQIRSSELVLRDCVVFSKDNVQLPAQVAGVIRSLELSDGTPVEEGVTIQRGDAIGTLDYDEALARQSAAQLEHKVAQAEEIKAKASVDAAAATTEVARAEYQESLDVNRRVADSIPKTQLRRQLLTITRAENEATVAARDVEVAGFTTELRGAQITLADLSLKKHQLVSPLDGVVVQLYRKRGEYVQIGEPIARVVHMQTLRVEGFVNAEDYLPEDVHGKRVAVVVNRPNREPETITTTVRYASPVVEASGEFRIWVEIENRPVSGQHWLIRPGMEVAMHIELDSFVGAE